MAQPRVGDDDFQDFLLDMDFDELIPVDNFFSNYMGALSEKEGTFGARFPSIDVQDIAQLYTDGSRPQVPQQQGMASGMVPQPQPVPPVPVTNIRQCQDRVAPAVSPTAGLPSHAMNGLTPAVPPAAQAPATQHVAPAQPNHIPDNYSHYPTDSPLSAENDSGGSAHRPSRRQTKTERQQMLNKAAQQRYRERKKAKAVELKQAVACLQDKVDELSIVQAEKLGLAERVDQLEKELALKEAQLVSAQKQGSAGIGGGGGGSAAEPSKECLEDFVCQFKGEVGNLREWLTARGYVHREMLVVEDLPPQDVDALRAATERCYAACLRCLSMFADVDITSLMDSTLDRSQMHFHGGPEMWTDLVRRLQLQPSAIQHALQLRRKYMARLDDLFNERQGLNLQAIKVLLPQDMGGLAISNKASGGASGGAPSFQERCKHAYATGAVLRRLRANLASEQKALAELDYLVYIKLLDPVQLSKCILLAFPEHCDVVSLLNAIHLQVNPQA